MTGGRNREIVNVVSEALDNMPVVVLTGMRQVGKTTFPLKQRELSKRRYISLDDFASLKAAESSPEELLEGDQPVTIDEVHKCPQLLTVIKQDVDRNRQRGSVSMDYSANKSEEEKMSPSLSDGRRACLVNNVMHFASQ